MEKRKFGNTGLETSLLGFGGFHLLEIPGKEAEYLLNTYLDAGGNYIETAAGYGDGESEIKIGRSTSKRRSEFILATKSSERFKEGFIASVNKSLENLKTDYVDLVLMHGVGNREELDAILGPNGAMEGFAALKLQGKARYVGISMHGQCDILVEALKQYPFDAVMTTINYYDHFNFPEIQEVLVPLATQKNTAIIIMKPLGDGLLWRSAPNAFKYAFSQPAATIVTGINTRDMLMKDLNYANEFIPMTEEEKEELYSNALELGNYVCRQCNKCVPCPENIPIPEIFKCEGYFDRQMADGKVYDAAEYALRQRLRFWFGNQPIAFEKYEKLKGEVEKCAQCGLCLPKCPYGIDIIQKLEIADYKLSKKKFF